jgi:hypothetical protein
VVGAERRDVIGQLAGPVRSVDEHPDTSAGRATDGCGHRRDRDDGRGRRGDPVDHDQPRTGGAGGRVRRDDHVVLRADRERRLDDPCPGARGVMIKRLADRAVAVRADHQLVAGPERQRTEHGGHAF